MIKINLLAEGKRPAAVRKIKPAQLLEGRDVGMYLLALAIVLGLTAFGIIWYIRRGEVAEKDAEVAEAEKEVATLSEVLKDVDSYKTKKAELERKIKVIEDLKQNQRGPVRVMDDVSRALPELLWLDKMEMNASTIQLEGRAFNTNAVANLIENLDRFTEFEEPTLKDTQEQTGGVYKFVISVNYSFGPKVDKSAKGKGGKDAKPGADGKGKDAGKDAGKDTGKATQEPAAASPSTSG